MAGGSTNAVLELLVVGLVVDDVVAVVAVVVVVDVVDVVDNDDVVGGAASPSVVNVSSEGAPVVTVAVSGDVAAGDELTVSAIGTQMENVTWQDCH